MRNAGKCGVCGDPYDGVRLHETGQSMALNETTRNYFPGSSIDLMVEIVANHGGTFKFEMCWRDDWSFKETEDCFEGLRLSNLEQAVVASSPNGNETATNASSSVENKETSEPSAFATTSLEDEFEYELDPASGTGIFTMSVDLPFNKTCENCILRWHWRSANNWGTCEDGSERVGCGHQEIYRNCADVSVKRNGAGIRLGFNTERRRRRR